MDFYDDVIKNRFYSYDIDEDIYENMNEFLVKFQDMIREFGIKTMMSLFSTDENLKTVYQTARGFKKFENTFKTGYEHIQKYSRYPE